MKTWFWFNNDRQMREIRECEKKWVHFKWIFFYQAAQHIFATDSKCSFEIALVILNMKGGENKITAPNEFVHLLLHCFMLKTFSTTFLLLLFMVCLFFFCLWFTRCKIKVANEIQGKKKPTLKPLILKRSNEMKVYHAKMNENKTEPELQLKLRVWYQNADKVGFLHSRHFSWFSHQWIILECENSNAKYDCKVKCARAQLHSLIRRRIQTNRFTLLRSHLFFHLIFACPAFSF